MQTADKSEFIEKNGYYLSTPQGNSMRPFIVGGRDIVTVAPLDGQAKKYDVILYRSESGHDVMHRVLGIKNGGYRVRGDNCYYNEFIRFDQVYGVIVRVLKNGRVEQKNTFRHRAAIRLWRYSYPLRYVMRYVRALLSRVKRRICKPFGK